MTPQVTVVIPTKDRPDLLAMVHDTLTQAGDTPLEAIFVDNGTTDPEALDALRRSPHRCLRAPIPFNFSRLVNRGARAASGDIIVLLNNDVEARRTGWLDTLITPLTDPDVGAAGIHLEYPSGRVQHCGIGFRDGVPVHLRSGESWDALPRNLRDGITEPPAVTGACMAVRADAWRDLGGMSTPLATNYNDVDFCLRLRRSGGRVACVPFRDLVHHESETRGTMPTAAVAADWLLFRSRWPAGPLRHAPTGESDRGFATSGPAPPPPR